MHVVTAFGVVCLVGSVIWLMMVYVARMRTWRGLLAGPAWACLVGSVVGSGMVYIAIEHNPQEEFVSHATGAINYAGLSEIFLSWFVVVSVAAGLALALVVWPLRGLSALYRLLRAQLLS